MAALKKEFCDAISVKIAPFYSESWHIGGLAGKTCGHKVLLLKCTINIYCYY